MLFISSFTAKSQMIFDTLDLKDVIIVSGKFNLDNSGNSQKIDTLIKRELNNLNLGELLMAESPVFIKSYGKGSLATASFRGTSASHTKVLWDDFELNSPMLGQLDLSLVPNSFFDNVKLNFGANSIENVSGALGGSIELDNNKTFDKNFISLSQSAGSFNTFSTSLKGGLKFKKLSSLSSVYLNSSDNDFDFYNNAIIPAQWQKQKNASFYNRGFVQSFEYKISGHSKLGIKSWNQWDFRNIPPIMSNVANNNQIEFQKSFNSRNIVSYNFNKGKSVISAKMAWFYEDLNYQLLTTSNNNSDDTVSFINSTNISKTTFARISYSLNLKHDFRIKIIGNYDLSQVNSNNYSDIKRRENTAVLFKLSKTFAEKVKAEIMLRQQYSDDKFIPLTPYFSVSYKPFLNESLFMSFSLGKNYHLPSLNDLYWFPGGNTDLLAEESMQSDVSIKYQKKFGNNNITASVSAYNSNIDNWIQWVPGDYRYWTAQNVEKVHSRGLESRISFSGKTTDLFYKFSINYSLNKSTNESKKAIEGNYSGRQLIYIPLHSGNMFVYGSYKGYNLTLTNQIIGERNTSLDEQSYYSNTLPAYSLTNISIGKNIKFDKFSLDIKFKVNNLFDKSYQAILWRAMPGRNYEVFIAIKI